MEMINDVLGYKNMKIYQNTDFFSFSLDSIILANFSTIRLRDKKIVDFCTGNAIVPLIMSRRTKSRIIGVEIQKKLCDLAKKSINQNKLSDYIEIVNSDIKDFSINNCNEKMVARHEVLIDLNGVVDCAKRVLKDNGTFCMVHRSDRLIEIIDCFKENNIEPKKIKFIYNNIDSNSTLVLIEGQKAGKCGLIVDKPLILHDLEGNDTEEYKKLQEVINNDTEKL